MTVDLYVTTQRRFRLEVHADEQPGSLPAAVTVAELVAGSHATDAKGRTRAAPGPTAVGHCNAGSGNEELRCMCNGPISVPPAMAIGRPDTFPSPHVRSRQAKPF